MESLFKNTRSLMIFMFLLAPVIALGQLPESKIVARVSYEHFFLTGKDYRNYSYVSLPALFSNMKMTNGYSAEIIYKIGGSLGAGLKYRYMSLSNWHLDDQLYYRNVKSRVSSVSPVVLYTLITGKRKSSGLSVEATLPGFTTLSLVREMVDNSYEQDEFFDFMGEKEIVTQIPGFGIEVIYWFHIGTSTGVTTSAGWVFYKTDSYHFPDASITGFTAKVGLVQSIFKDKLYMYR